MKIVKSHEMQWADAMQQGRYGQRRKPLGGEKLSCGLWELAPGKKSFPFHMHHVTEEAMFVVSGSGKVRSTDGEHPIGPGDYVSFLPGKDAHQLINDGSEPLVYLGMGAGQGFDVVEYPDSKKVASSVGTFPTGKRFIFKMDAMAQYFDGESDADAKS